VSHISLQNHHINFFAIDLKYLLSPSYVTSLDAYCSPEKGIWTREAGDEHMLRGINTKRKQSKKDEGKLLQC